MKKLLIVLSRTVAAFLTFHRYRCNGPTAARRPSVVRWGFVKMCLYYLNHASR